MSNYWRSFTELFRKDDFQEQNAGENKDAGAENSTAVNRRHFIGALSASAAVIATSCKNYRDEGELVPYNQQREDAIPGQDVYYASSIGFDGQSHPVLIRTRDGRPNKIDGNPQHPLAMGKADSQTQALLMSLFEPDRIRQPQHKGGNTDWSALESALKQAFASGQKEVALLTGVVSSPSLAKLLQGLQVKYPKVKVYSADLNGRGQTLAVHHQVTGLDYLPAIALDKAKVIVSVAADFLGAEATIESKRLYAQTRNVVETGKLGKFYAIEGNFSATGMNADERLRLREDLHAGFLAALLRELIKQDASLESKLGNLPAAIQGANLSNFISEHNLNVATIHSLVADLLLHKNGSAVLVVGNTHSPTAQALTHAINLALGAYGTILTNKYAWKPTLPIASNEDLQNLAADLKGNKLDALLIWGINPAYHLAQYGFESALAQLENVFYFGNLSDETAAHATWVAPISHALESWGDHGDRLGLWALQQPMIAPLFASRQVEDFLVALFLDKPWSDRNYREYLRFYWQDYLHAQSGTSVSATDFWNLSLHDGFASYALAESTPTWTWINLDLTSAKGVLLSIKNHPNIGDGELAHVGWLQELPHPVSKVTWDNYIAISPAMAEKLGFRLFPKRTEWSYDVAKITVNGQSIQGVVLPQPGLAEDQIVIELGYGRSKAGAIGSGLGFQVRQLLRTTQAGNLSAFQLADVQIAPTSQVYDLAITQENNAIDADKMAEPCLLAAHLHDAHHKRGIIRDGTYKEYLTNPNFLQEDQEEIRAMDRSFEYKGVKWAMAIDLNKCIGCSDCITACNVENNVPVVGKDMVIMGREMHWLRIDRYYAGTSDAPAVSVQPMLCQQCDNAPCENVCPVAATAHSPEGLNDIAYNRCLGTRYCANTCAYKVRRFNYYNYRDHLADAHQEKPVFALLHNPEVTVRSRGVIEKCSFCVQRINLGRADSKRKGDKWNGQGVSSACQDACPTNAIAFGNVNDLKSDVRRRKDHKLTYRVLAETGTEPNVHYQAKLRNAEGKIL